MFDNEVGDIQKVWVRRTQVRHRSSPSIRLTSGIGDISERAPGLHLLHELKFAPLLIFAAHRCRLGKHAQDLFTSQYGVTSLPVTARHAVLELLDKGESVV
ncbi:hypothetical protein [Variovorax sp. J31P207]|uniref:hypothetical protein n=1 Tax=Variovorax sp. J31P207 TaxID=3053510 RepID=UPI0025786EF3|nr:hypothetical protein [Variovorax sp. J31P207]MDM0065294.1 hypothetical protein [Variovorax sp. J31P207]